MNASTRLPRPRFKIWLTLLTGTLVLGACRGLPRVPPGVLFDPQMGPAEQTYFRQSFEERPSSIRLGPGWFSEEKGWGEDHLGVSWCGRLAQLYFGAPQVRSAELVALATAFTYPGAPPQTVTPILNGHELATVTFTADWNELRFPLPPEDLIAPINTLDLRFSHAAIPAKVGVGTDDRTLAAAFNLIAILPRGEPLAEARSTVEGRGADRKLVLRREPIALPLPPATHYEIQLGSITGAGERLAVDFESRSGIGDAGGAGRRRRLWEGPAMDAAWRRFRVEAPRAQAARLLLTRRIVGREPPARTPRTIEMTAPEVYARPQRERAAGPPDVFLYLIDTLRADAVGVYGSRRPTTPWIDRFSRDAVVFAEARSPASWTLPATASILSGLYPSRHGVVHAGDRLAAARVPWLPTLLAQQGYETIGVSQWLLGGDTFGLERGFARFYINVRQNAKTRSAAVRWFLWQHLLNREQPENPLFCYLHVVDPHARYRPGHRDRSFADEQPGTLTPDLYAPDLFMHMNLGRNPDDVAHLRALYDGEVHAADRQFGGFVAQLKFFDLYDESLIILVGDHGEEFGEHGGFDHGRTLYEELLRVPLIVKFPRSWGLSGRIAQPVSTVDIAPTILELLAGAGPAGRDLQGMSLVPLARGETGAERQLPLYSETEVDAVNLKAALLGTVKCIANATGVDRNSRPAPPFEAFDLARDPRERAPLAPGDRGVERCRQELAAWLAHPADTLAERRPLAPEDRAKLRSLGYIR